MWNLNVTASFNNNFSVAYYKQSLFLSAADEESFEDNPEEYIRRDMEGSDIDTRRRAACDLVRALSKSFEGPVISNFSQYVQAMLAVSSVLP